MVDFYGTVKFKKNFPLTDPSQMLDIERLFMCEKNREYLINQVFLLNKQNGAYGTYQQFAKLVPRLMEKFNLENRLGETFSSYYCDDQLSTVDQLGLDTYRAATGYNAISTRQNWLESFRAINMKFLEYTGKFLKWNVYVPFRAYSTTGSINEFENNVRDVKNSNLLADDIKSVNVWRRYDINTDRSKYRYQNTIPFWQYTMNTRHLDRSNQGLREGNDSYRSSLDNPIYAYDMRNVKELTSRYQDEKWFGF